MAVTMLNSNLLLFLFALINFPCICKSHGDDTYRPLIRFTRPAVFEAPQDERGIHRFVDMMNWMMHYPELIGYERYGNGYVAGDLNPQILLAGTDMYGHGSILIEFPPVKNSISGDIDGLHHPHVKKQVRGYHVELWPLQGNVEFPPEPRQGVSITFFVPTDRSYAGYYLDFDGMPDSDFAFLIERTVSWYGPFIPHGQQVVYPPHTEL
ncbi:hypothetical protein [Sclerotinia sclerotiorum deltaflexivirus 3S2]|nr:hypothetical protein [Sclerotinia sclerotiorum deltaflexivirus 3S2]